MSSKWSYQVIELKARWWGGMNADAAREQLVKLGLQGWDLVSVTYQGAGHPVLAYLKKEI